MGASKMILNTVSVLKEIFDPKGNHVSITKTESPANQKK